MLLLLPLSLSLPLWKFYILQKLSFAEAIFYLETAAAKIRCRDFSLKFSRGHFETDQNASSKTPGVEMISD